MIRTWGRPWTESRSIKATRLLRPLSRIAPTSLAVNPAAVKTTSHYIKALRRRFWMVLCDRRALGDRFFNPGAQASPGLHGQGRDRDQPPGNRP